MDHPPKGEPVRSNQQLPALLLGEPVPSPLSPSGHSGHHGGFSNKTAAVIEFDALDGLPIAAYYDCSHLHTRSVFERSLRRQAEEDARFHLPPLCEQLRSSLSRKYLLERNIEI